MKRVWVCQWEIARGDGLHAEEYDSFSEAVRAMRQKITECIDLEEYIADLEPNEGNFLQISKKLQILSFPYLTCLFVYVIICKYDICGYRLPDEKGKFLEDSKKWLQFILLVE